MGRIEGACFRNACQEDVPVLRDASCIAMTRRPRIRRGRRNFTLDELLTDAEPGPTEELAPDLAPEVGKPVKRLFRRRVLSASRSALETIEDKNGPSARRTIAHAARNYASGALNDRHSAAARRP